MAGTLKHKHPGRLPIKESIDLLLQECAKVRAELLDPGPWNAEPDYQQFEAHGLHCIVSRNPMVFNWCGYVGVPPGHPAYGKDWKDLMEIDVHGGLTFASECGNHICHIPEPGEPDQLWWLGFDCAHYGDLVPGVEAMKRKLGPSPEIIKIPEFMKAEFEKMNRQTYKTYDYVRKETIYLAEQLKDMGERDGSGGQINPGGAQ